MALKHYRIEAPYMVAGLDAQDGIVTRAAPIIRWTVGKPQRDVALWCARKGFQMQDFTHLTEKDDD